MNGYKINTYRRLAALGIGICSAVWAQDAPISPTNDLPPILKIGSAAPPFNLPGIDGKMHSLKEYDRSKLLMLIFTCDHCPVAQMYEKRIKELATTYQPRGVAVVAIMPNDPKAVHLSEMGYTDLGDSLPEMKVRAKYRHFNFPYLSDGATQEVAKLYGPTATPHVFLFDEQRKLRYEGRIDSNQREELATKHEAKDAVEALLAGRPVIKTDTPAVGCSTKWAFKEEGAKAELGESEQEPVAITLASVSDLTKLRKNVGTDKLLLVNFWATWCGPCVGEFPELQKMIRMYRKRAIDFVTVSINTPDEQKMVLSFLNKQHATGRNLLFNSNDAAEAMPSFADAGWTGGAPFTALIGMHGEVLYKTQGAFSTLDVERAILKNLPDDSYIGQHAYWNSSF